MLMMFLGTGRTIDPSDGSRTFFRKIKKIPASHWLKYDLQHSSITIKRYWDVSKKVQHISFDDTLQRLSELITTSVKRRLRSDVALGTSLSGGLDSSTIAATLSGLGIRNLKTFTASFPGFEKDETRKAVSMAEKFHLKNFTVEPSAQSLADDLEKMAYHQDEPVASGSVYAQFKVFELAAREGVTVLLDGQGADEIFGGYDHYRKWRLRTILPRLTARVLEKREGKDLQQNSFFNEDFFASASGEINIVKPVVSELNDLLYFDTFCSGLEQLLRYADRNSMTHGREVRLPYLYHELVSFVFSLPSTYKIHEGYTKWVLRELMKDKIPAEIVWLKRKTGFEPPQKKWMEEPRMKQYIMEAKQNLVNRGILDKVVLDQRLSSHEAFEKKANDWRWLATSLFLNKKGV
jgi:asparagine synthase (glutamine-hydrolysing)